MGNRIRNRRKRREPAAARIERMDGEVTDLVPCVRALGRGKDEAAQEPRAARTHGSWPKHLGFGAPQACEFIFRAQPNRDDRVI